MNRRAILFAFTFVARLAFAAERHSVTGVVLKVDPEHKSFTASCAAIPGYMEAMVMPFKVTTAKALDGIRPGANVEFTLVVEGRHSHAENIRARRFESMEQEALRARRLQLLQEGGAPQTLVRGQQAPDFSLPDQTGHRISLLNFAGKVIALNFIYTGCPLPEYCFRLSNNFGRLSRRFAGQDLVLLSVSFDPVHDTPQALATYAGTWKADARTWHFLTGDLPEVQAVCRKFGLNFWQDEGLLTHSLRTVVIDRQGKLAATFDGNQFTAEQLGDFIATELQRRF